MRMLMVGQPKIVGADAESQVYALDSIKRYHVDEAKEHPYFKKLLPEADIDRLAVSVKSYRHFLREGINRSFELSEGAESFIEKSPIHTLYYSQILQDYPNAEVILVSRNYGAIAHSMVWARWIPIIGKRLAEIPILRIIPYLAAVVICYDYQQVIQSLKKDIDYKLVQYEELVKLDRQEAREYLSGLIGIDLEPLYIERPFSPEASSRERTLHTDRISAFKRSTPQLILWLEERLFSDSPRNSSKLLDSFFDMLIRFRRRRSNRP